MNSQKVAEITITWMLCVLLGCLVYLALFGCFEATTELLNHG